MPTLKDVLCALAIVIAYGIAGCMDYDDDAMLHATRQPSETTAEQDGTADDITTSAAQAEDLEPTRFGDCPPLTE